MGRSADGQPSPAAQAAPPLLQKAIEKFADAQTPPAPARCKFPGSSKSLTSRYKEALEAASRLQPRSAGPAPQPGKVSRRRRATDAGRGQGSQCPDKDRANDAGARSRTAMPVKAKDNRCPARTRSAHAVKAKVKPWQARAVRTGLVPNSPQTTAQMIAGPKRRPAAAQGQEWAWGMAKGWYGDGMGGNGQGMGMGGMGRVKGWAWHGRGQPINPELQRQHGSRAAGGKTAAVPRWPATSTM